MVRNSIGPLGLPSQRYESGPDYLPAKVAEETERLSDRQLESLVDGDAAQAAPTTVETGKSDSATET